MKKPAKQKKLVLRKKDKKLRKKNVEPQKNELQKKDAGKKKLQNAKSRRQKNLPAKLLNRLRMSLHRQARYCLLLLPARFIEKKILIL